MPADAIVLHGHAYQPPRADPRTGEVPVEPSAAPFHDWNERITAECYRPNAYARIYDDDGRIVRIVNNWERMSFNLGPTLAHWLARHAPDVHDRIVEADRVGRTAIAQPFHHIILPLAPIEDARTELLWGIADFEHRFGRKPEGVWFPETAVDAATMALLPEVGLSFTILAPYQVSPRVPSGSIGRWAGPTGPVELVVYDGSVSHDLAFGNVLADSTALVERLQGAAPSGIVVAATDAETFGHHHRFTERGVAHALFSVAERAGVRTGGLPGLLGTVAIDRAAVAEIPPSAWSCAHGIGRWHRDCGCSTDGQQSWNQAWRAPLRQALDVLRDHAVEVFRRRGAEVFHDPMAARDAFGTVLADPAAWDRFVETHVRPMADERLARLLLDSQEATLASFTSCAWFFADLARREVIIVLQEAYRSVELLTAIDERPPMEEFLEILAHARSNNPLAPTGAEVWDCAANGDGVLPHERLQPGAPTFPAPSSLTDLLLDLVRRSIDGSAAAAVQAAELIEVTAKAGILLPLERAQELVWTAIGDGPPPQLEPLLAVLGFAPPRSR